MNIFKKFRLAKSPVFELNKNRQYLIGIDSRYFTKTSAERLQKELKRMGINNLLAMFDGDPNQAIRIIKSKAKPAPKIEADGWAKPSDDDLKAMVEMPLPEGALYTPPTSVIEADKELDELCNSGEGILHCCGQRGTEPEVARKKLLAWQKKAVVAELEKVRDNTTGNPDTVYQHLKDRLTQLGAKDD